MPQYAKSNFSRFNFCCLSVYISVTSSPPGTRSSNSSIPTLSPGTKGSTFYLNNFSAIRFLNYLILLSCNHCQARLLCECSVYSFSSLYLLLIPYISTKILPCLLSLQHFLFSVHRYFNIIRFFVIPYTATFTDRNRFCVVSSCFNNFLSFCFIASN